MPKSLSWNNWYFKWAFRIAFLKNGKIFIKCLEKCSIFADLLVSVSLKITQILLISFFSFDLHIYDICIGFNGSSLYVQIFRLYIAQITGKIEHFQKQFQMNRFFTIVLSIVNITILWHIVRYKLFFSYTNRAFLETIYGDIASGEQGETNQQVFVCPQKKLVVEKKPVVSHSLDSFRVV